ncbi:MAG TPA: hypothetical protein VF824_08445 [Thermoanaerobaculia bacterium]|jgi:hypothetical protein
MTTRRPRVSVFLLAMLLALPALAQSRDEKIDRLQKQLEELLRQAESIRQQLQELRPSAETAPAEAEDLTQVEVAPAPAETPAPAEAPAPAATAETAPSEAAPSEAAAPAIADVQPVENASAAGAAKALNPDISAIGTFIGHAGDVNAIDERAPIDLDEVELALEAFIDPYAKGRFFLSFHNDEVEVEEGYAQFVTLPWGLTAKVGKTKALFGKANTWHTHTRPWVDQPLMIARFFGDEGLNDVGVSVSKTINNPFNTFVEVTGEAYRGDVEQVFGRASQNDLFYNTHVKAFRDLTENSNLETGASFAAGTLPESSGHNRFAGIDVTYRWKPLEQALYKSFIARLEALRNTRSDFDGALYGYYASADYQLARRWYTGVRFDRADAPAGFGRERDRGLSATLTFWPSEFSQIRGQYRRTKLGDGPTYDELLLQLQFAIGAHGAHTF